MCVCLLQADEALKQEEAIPRLWKKEQWQFLPPKLEIGSVFSTRVNCSSVSMAYAESTGISLKVKSGGINAQVISTSPSVCLSVCLSIRFLTILVFQILKYTCVGCEKFQLHFGARGTVGKVVLLLPPPSSPTHCRPATTGNLDGRW
eukprot:COSAG05_NODE_1410_length_4959_cov_12.965226_1_plen_147_part_00